MLSFPQWMYPSARCGERPATIPSDTLNYTRPPPETFRNQTNKTTTDRSKGAGDSLLLGQENRRPALDRNGTRGAASMPNPPTRLEHGGLSWMTAFHLPSMLTFQIRTRLFWVLLGPPSRLQHRRATTGSAARLTRGPRTRTDKIGPIVSPFGAEPLTWTTPLQMTATETGMAGPLSAAAAIRTRTAKAGAP
jgi:hypothetical protein